MLEKILPLLALLSCSANQYYDNSYLCEVQVERRDDLQVATTKKVIEQKKEVRVLELYFPSGSSTLSDEDYAKLEEYADSLPENTSMLIEGYADYRGSFEVNKNISGKRVDYITTILGVLGYDFQMQKVALGEKKATQDTDNPETLQKDRKVKLVAPAEVITEGLDTMLAETSLAETYLLDQSRSMNEMDVNGKRKWQQVQQYRFPQESEVYTFSTEGRVCGGSIGLEKPKGSTPLYVSMYTVLAKMKENSALTVLTDGEDNQGGRSVEEIVSLAYHKNIAVSIIGLGLYHNQSKLEFIAIQTGGKFYFSY